MDEKFSTHIINVFTFLLLIFAFQTSDSYSQPECQNVPTSNGPAPIDLVHLCSPPIDSTPNVGTSVVGELAFGWEFVSSDVDSVELPVPEVLTPVVTPEFRDGSFVTGCDFDNSNPPQNLYCIDEDGTFFLADVKLNIFSRIGSNGSIFTEGFTGLAMDQTTGIMYASSNDLSQSSLHTVNIATGATIRIGEVTNSPALIAIAVNNQGQMFGYDIVLDSLIKIDKNTGAGTIVGPLGFNANFAQGMDFNESDNKCYLFAFNSVSFRPELRTCNTRTGLTTLVGVLGETSPGDTIQITGAGIAAKAPNISINPITPGVGNIINYISSEGSSPNGNVAFVWGIGPGSVKIGGNVCNGLEIELKKPKLIGITRSSADQLANLGFFVPFFSESDIVLYTQAVDVKSCVTSEVLPNVIVNN